MSVILFWNIAKNPIGEKVALACFEHEVDILILAECSYPTSEIITYLNKFISPPFFFEFALTTSAVRFFLRYPESAISALYDDGRASIRKFSPPVGREIIIVAVHLPSKLHRNDDDQYYIVRGLAAEIREAEYRVGHSNSIVIGDFNMDPFEIPMVAADGFHAVMDRDVARKGSRIAQGRSWNFFYNPMWSFVGDTSNGPSGTYYLNKGGSLVNLFWNTFDQVLIRPSFIEFLEKNGVHVIVEIGVESLLSSNVINKAISDHLPILINLKIERDI